jgi:hypothetical protein
MWLAQWRRAHAIAAGYAAVAATGAAVVAGSLIAAVYGLRQSRSLCLLPLIVVKVVVSEWAVHPLHMQMSLIALSSIGVIGTLVLGYATPAIISSVHVLYEVLTVYPLINVYRCVCVRTHSHDPLPVTCSNMRIVELRDRLMLVGYEPVPTHCHGTPDSCGTTSTHSSSLMMARASPEQSCRLVRTSVARAPSTIALMKVDKRLVSTTNWYSDPELTQGNQSSNMMLVILSPPVCSVQPHTLL